MGSDERPPVPGSGEPQRPRTDEGHTRGRLERVRAAVAARATKGA